MSTKVSPEPLFIGVSNNNGNKGDIIGPKTKVMESSRMSKLYCYYWPPASEKIKALAYISHGFSEHMQWYEDLALRLSAIGILAFGHDHVGHGRSEGVRAHVTTVAEYTKDVINHCETVLKEYNVKKLFIIGHSMGGMIAIRAVMSNPSLFAGMVLIGPLIQPHPDEVTPLKLTLAKLVSNLIPLMPVASLNQSHVTRDDDMRKKMSKDPLRYHGGIRARWAMACHEELFRIKEANGEVTLPFFLLHGEKDKICSPEASETFFNNAQSKDKKLKIYPDAFHHLYIEKPDVRKEALQDTLEWVEKRISGE